MTPEKVKAMLNEIDKVYEIKNKEKALEKLHELGKKYAHPDGSWPLQIRWAMDSFIL